METDERKLEIAIRRILESLLKDLMEISSSFPLLIEAIRETQPELLASYQEKRDQSGIADRKLEPTDVPGVYATQGQLALELAKVLAPRLAQILEEGSRA